MGSEMCIRDRRLFFTLSMYLNHEVTEADYTTAYLNALRRKPAFMKQPPGFEKVGPNGEKLICKLLRALYGLVDSGLEWETTHHSALKKLGWEQSSTEPCLFRRTFPCGTTAYLCTYVDNLFLSFPPSSPLRTLSLIHISEPTRPY